MIIGLLFLSIIVGVLIKIPFLNIPLDRDYGVYGHHALFWLQGKKMPYKDTSENHPPGRWLLYSFLLKYFHVSPSIFRWSNILFISLTNIIVFLTANLFFDVNISLTASFFFAIISSLPVLKWVQSSDEVQQIFFTSLAVYGVVLNPENSVLFILVGLAAFLALFFKQSAYINTLPVVLLLSLYFNDFVDTGMILVGIITGYILTYIFFLYEKIPTHNYKYIFVLQIDSFISHLSNLLWLSRYKKKKGLRSNSQNNSTTHAKSPVVENIFDEIGAKSLKVWISRLILNYVKQTNFFLIFFLAGLALITLTQGLAVNWLPVGIWFGFCFITLLLNQHLMPYHFFPVIAPLSILSGFGFVESYRWMDQYAGSLISISVIIAVSIFSIWLLRKDIKDWIIRERKRRGDIFGGWELSYAGEHIGKYLASVTSQEDQIYVWGDEHEIYLWAQRPSPTRTLFCPHPNLNYTPFPMGEENQRLEELKSNPPRYIVIMAMTKGYMRLVSFINNYYIPDKKMFDIQIYRRKENINTIEIPKLVSIIILTYNALKFTKQCIETIQAYTKYPYEIIFVDNGSTDDTVEYLRSLTYSNPHFKLIVNSRNLGFSAGNNQASEIARGDYLLFLNNDVIVSEDWLSRMVTTLNLDKSIGMVGPITNNISGRQMIKKIQYSDEDGFHRFANTVSIKNKHKRRPQRRIAGFAVLMRKNVFKEVDGFDELYGIGNGEDIDLCMKIRELGLEILVDESVYIHHYGSRTFAENNIDYEQSLSDVKSRFKDKWGDIHQNWLLEVDESLEDINASIVNNGMKAFKSKNVEKAKSQFEKVLNTNPIDSSAILGLAMCSHSENNHQQTLQYIRKLLVINPENAEAYNLGGLVSMETGDLKNSKILFMKALNISPSFIEAQQNYSNILQLMKS